jgi:hypothetical protein
MTTSIVVAHVYIDSYNSVPIHTEAFGSWADYDLLCDEWQAACRRGLKYPADKTLVFAAALTAIHYRTSKIGDNCIGLDRDRKPCAIVANQKTRKEVIYEYRTETRTEYDYV